MGHKEKPGILELYISSLSDEDRENYKEMIEEFRARDARISRECEEARHSMQALGNVQIRMIGKLKELEAASERLLKSNVELYLNLVDKKKLHS